MTTTHGSDYTPNPPDLGTNHPQCCGIWIVARTHPKAEFWASANLSRRGFQSFLPTYATHVRDRILHTTRIVDRPLFASYVFVAHSKPTVWRPIRETPGILSVLVSGDRAQYVQRGAVEALAASQHLRTIPPPPNAHITPGAAVSLNTGPFRGSHAVVATRHGSNASVTLMFLGELRTLLVSVDHLTPIS